MLFDTHAHIADPSFDDDRELMLARAQEAGITQILCICTDLDKLLIAKRLKEQYPWISLAAGTHPHDAAAFGTRPIEALEKELSTLCAIGEIGLDYHYNHAPKEVQLAVLESYLRFAESVNKPVIIHCREAFADFFALWDRVNQGKLKGVMHCFTGSEAEALESLSRGLYLSFSGVVTFPKSQALRDLIPQIPHDRILIETDAPFLAPPPFRGKRAEPAHVRIVASYVAEALGLTLEETASLTTSNAQRLFFS
jgi:hydrolase, TatD family